MSPIQLTSPMLTCEACGKRTQTLYNAVCLACSPVPCQGPAITTPAPRLAVVVRMEQLRQVEMLLGKIKDLQPTSAKETDPQEAATWERIQNKLKEIFE